MADANYGLPMYSATRPANASDVVVMNQDLDDCLALYRELSPRYFLGDKGYDRLSNFEHVVSLGMVPVIAVRLAVENKATGKRLYDGLYEADGRPTCVGGQSMVHWGTDPEQGHLLACPEVGCHLKDSVQFTRHCDYTHYEKPEGNLLRIVGLLPRWSEEWKTEYKKRTTVERFIGSGKQSRLLDTHRYLNMGKVSLLSNLVTALAHLKADDYAHMRHMRIGCRRSMIPTLSRKTGRWLTA